MTEMDQAEDYHIMVQDLNECSSNVAHARERYGKEPFPEIFSSENVWLHGDINLDDYVEDADADMRRTTENEIAIIKEEIEIKEECIILPNRSKSSVKLIPVVYTTRLDDMSIFNKNFASLTVEDIVGNVILESKPKLTKSFKDKIKGTPTFDDHPFFKLVDKIREFNELSIVQDDDNDDNLNVLSNLQDENDFNVLSTVQNDNDDDNYNEDENIPLKLLTSKRDNLNINRHVKARRKAKSLTSKEKKKQVINHTLEEKKTQVVSQCKPCTVPLTASCKTCIINGKSCVIYDKKSNEPQTFIKGVFYKINFGCYIVFTNLKTQSTDVYIFDKQGLFSRTFDGLEYNLTRWYNGWINYGLKVDECCWFHREYVIKSLIWPESLVTRFSILQKAHSCPSGRCNCCCKIHIIEDDDIEEVPLANSIEDFAETVACQLVRSFKSSDNEARTPCNRKNKLRNDNTAETAEDLTETKDRLGVQILKNYSDMTEFYELRSNGNVLKHIEIMSKYLHTSYNFRRAMKLNADSGKEFCCWRKRDAMLQTFEFKNTMITQFIRTPHPCPPGHCICCCKPTLFKTSLKVNDLTDLKYVPRHAYNYTNIIKQRRKCFAKAKYMNTLMQGDINAKSDQYEPSKKPDYPDFTCEELIDYESFISGDIIDKTVESSITGKNVLQKKPIGNKGVSPKNVLRNRVTNDTNNDSIAQKNTSQKRLVGKTSQVTKNPNNNIILNASVASPPTQPQGLASRPQLPIQPSSLFQISQQPRPPLVPPHPGPFQLGQNTIAPAQSNVAFPVNNSFPVLNPLTNIPLHDGAHGLTVNSLVHSILQRFSDVRLIITPDGDVSAELNMPIQNLTTQELQILSQILTHAKEQVKQLKAAGHLNSGTSTVINPWQVRNSNLTQTPDVNSIPVIIMNPPTAPVAIVNTDPSAAATHATASSSNVSTSSKTMINKENDVKGKLRDDAFQCYTNLSALKMKEYLTSCRSYLDDIKFAPKIGDVFSLNKNATKSQTSRINTKKSENISNVKTYVGKRKGKGNPRSDTKKLKTMELTESIEIDDLVREEIPLQPNISTIPITAPVDMKPPSILSGKMSGGTGTSPVIDSDQVYVASPVTLPSGVPPLSPTNDPFSKTPTNEDDCILGF